MFNIIFNSPPAEILDILSFDPDVSYTIEEIAKQCKSDKTQLEEALKKLQLYNFVGNGTDNKYYIKNNEITNAYIIADVICRRKNNDTLHDLFDKGIF